MLCSEREDGNSSIKNKRWSMSELKIYSLKNIHIVIHDNIKKTIGIKSSFLSTYSFESI